jgi:phage terminase small subunit
MTDKTFQKYKLVIDEWLVNSRNGVKAYQKFYPKSKYKSADSNFRKILENTRIAKYVEEKTSETSQKLQISFESQLQDLEDIKGLAKKKSKYGDAISAVKEQNKMLGYYEKDNEQKSNIVTETREERDKRIEELIRKRNGAD